MFSPQPNKTKPTTSSLKFHFFFLISVFPTTKQNLAKQPKKKKKCIISSQIQKQNRKTLPFSLPLCVISATKQNLTNKIFIKFSTFSHLCVPENQTKLSRAKKKKCSISSQNRKTKQKNASFFSLPLCIISATKQNLTNNIFINTHTFIHTYIQSERERERESL